MYEDYLGENFHYHGTTRDERLVFINQFLALMIQGIDSRVFTEYDDEEWAPWMAAGEANKRKKQMNLSE